MKKDEWQNKLNEIAEYKDGWDSYDAEAPAPIAIQNVRNFLDAFSREPNRVAASAMGGVAATFKGGIHKVFVEFYNNGTAHMLFSSGEKMATFPVDVNDYQPTYEGIKNYLSAAPPLTPLKVLTTESTDELNWLVGLYVFDLPELHYWRRKSMYSNTEPMWEKCSKGETTPDSNGSMKANPAWMDGFWHRCVPYFSTKEDDCMWMLRSLMKTPEAWRKFLAAYMHLTDTHKHYGTADAVSWLSMVLTEFNPLKITKAVLLSVCES